MPTHDIRRPFKRSAISDQQTRRELSLLRQQQNRREAQIQARRLLSTVLSLRPETLETAQPDPMEVEEVPELEPDFGPEEARQQQQHGASTLPRDITDVRQASRLRGAEVRKWFAKQLMLPEWMIDVPDRLTLDWYYLLMVKQSANYAMALFCIIFHPCGQADLELGRIRDLRSHIADHTYYVVDMVCWRRYSLYDCTVEFRFFWLNSKLAESGACEPPSHYDRYRFSVVPVYNCDKNGLLAAYAGSVPYVKDGLLFYNKHAHYQAGNTPLTLVWKGETCSQYVIDMDSKGEVPTPQQVVFELQSDGRLTISDDPPVVFSCLDAEFIQKG